MYDISQKIDKFNLEILIKIKEITDKLKIDYFIVGATVRDIILNYVYDIIIYRATNDIDFAVRIRNWDEYKLLVGEIEKAGFVKDERIIHRYRYNGMIIDFIPFGLTKDDVIVWPDKDRQKMNVIGFNDAFVNREDILIQTDPEIVIKAASVECLAMLKIFSWNERSIHLRLSDAKDLYLIITTYLKAGNEERLFDYPDIVEQAEDYELSGAILLGRDMSKIISGKVLQSLLDILRDDTLALLANDMSRYELIYRESDDEKREWCEKLLKSLLQGLINKV
ncbi:MAG: nucleotidyl transferase AbiEii/AbiGii toxin family protein [Clostridiaceae bacterium]|nr:nucleotidyl transferase AbiEii/AbiGii toxin family protein [Clostridiaceae bacterium]